MTSIKVSNLDATAGPRVLFFGMRCAFSAPPLAALLAAGVNVVGVVTPGNPKGPLLHVTPPLRLAQIALSPVDVFRVRVDAAPSIGQLATQHAVPLLAVGDLAHPALLATISGFAPDLIVVACFPRRLPDALLANARLGSLNMHPSLLPRWRGPDPLFWTFRNGDAVTGVTIHRMTSTFDTGPILRQTAIDVPPGVRSHELEQTLAQAGASALVEVVRDAWAGATSSTAQDESFATQARQPRDEDWLVSTARDAAWAFNFVRGVAALGGPLAVVVEATGLRIPIADAIAVTSTMEGGATPSGPILRDGETISVQFSAGSCRFLLGNEADNR